MPPRSIALFGLFGVGNIGNEATLAATVHAVRTRLPQARLALVSDPIDPVAEIELSAPHLAPDALPIGKYLQRVEPPRLRELCRSMMQRATEPWRRRRTREMIADVDLLLVPGTGIADDFGQGPLDAPHQLRRWCAVARERGAAVRFVSIGAGPVQHPLSRRWFRQALAAADYRSYRERSSKEFALQVGVPAAADPVLPDLVFSLPIPEDLAAREVRWPPRVVGIGVMGYFGWNVDAALGKTIYASYLSKLSWLTGELLDRGYGVRLLTGSRGRDRMTVADLSAAMAARASARPGSFVVANIHSYRDVLREIAATDSVVATRFHNVLLALMLGRPVISIGYAQKNDDLMAEMGLADYCHAIETFDPQRVLAQFEQMASLPQPPMAMARQRVAQYRELLERQYDHVFRGI